MLRPFHLAIPVKEIIETRAFYRDVMGFEEGRSSDRWVDFNFFGHQLVIHQVDSLATSQTNPVDGHEVPVPHFGVVLTIAQWKALAAKLEQANITFIIKPHIRFEGQVGEQATMFFKDPSGNALEFKAFEDLSQLFAK
jgi:extradiol dioxygenase family protein